ncbi:MAG: glycosyltransferase family 2 protein [Bacteroidales bacterium]
MAWYKKYLKIYERAGGYDQQVAQRVSNFIHNQKGVEPLISAVMIAYNEREHILASLWSLIENRPHFPFEIVVVDNNSTDGTGELLERAAIPFVKEEKRGPGHARNRGLAEARGEFIVTIDSDTLYPPRYLEKIYRGLQREGVVAISSLWSFIPSKRYPRWKMVPYEFLRDIHLLLLSIKSPERAIRGMVFAHRADLAREVGGYKTNIKRGEDGSMAYRLKDYGKIKFIISHHARPFTSTGTLELDGPLRVLFWRRVKFAVKGIKKFFIATKGEIEDQESNLL